ncbi:uncharacterized protein BJ171DRAFT_482948 [Polychytrium aggregatum]|uniref:uncharacterized protein n=1 Tax=Polychytrium aggregatum TaxID=110093 RepID=UPI0022FE5CED|nr:uncharacterized protein BJ171DRAFT_482948 [Polychytrium aggregatum]KAI9190512.1 hypothetical protein BJ171DRAFT_482948 [Polychytrium aggregatum]
MDNIEQLIQDASAIKLPKWKLDKLKGEWEAEFRKGDQNLSEIDQVKVENRHLKEQLKRMEQMYQQLNLEHTQLANELLEYKLKAEKSGRSCRGAREPDSRPKPRSRRRWTTLCKKNLALVGYNDKLQDEIQVLEMELIKTRQEYVAVCRGARRNDPEMGRPQAGAGLATAAAALGAVMVAHGCGRVRADAVPSTVQ